MDTVVIQAQCVVDVLWICLMWFVFCLWHRYESGVQAAPHEDS